VKVKLFSVKSRDRKTRFDTLEADINGWLADHPSVVIEQTNGVSHPNLTWSHLALAIWYTEKSRT
jgi:hypothetical protein